MPLVTVSLKFCEICSRQFLQANTKQKICPTCVKRQEANEEFCVREPIEPIFTAPDEYPGYIN